MPKVPAALYKMTSEVLAYPGMGGWRFLVVPKRHSQEIKEKFGKRAKGWGSLPVSVTVRKTAWQTSIFPDKKSGCYLLPLKSKVRAAEGIQDESKVRFSLQVR
jgi:hypothetical protein